MPQELSRGDLRNAIIIRKRVKKEKSFDIGEIINYSNLIIPRRGEWNLQVHYSGSEFVSSYCLKNMKIP